MKNTINPMKPTACRNFPRAYHLLVCHFFSIALLVVCPPAGAEVSPSPTPHPPADRWGDLGDGTYANPILPGDFSDLDAIRVGSDYYAISSTFQFSPGVIVLQSKDLVNWKIIGHVVQDLRQIGPELNWDRMNRYGKGVWAGSIRHHDGKFWVYFGTPDEGYFMSTAKDPVGPWEPLHQMLNEPGWDDCCPFWDDDGQGYFVGTQMKNNYSIHLFKLTPDGRDLVPGSDKIIQQSKGSEANKFYKIDGTYYHYYSEVRPEGRVIMMNRSKNIYGPYETKQLNHAQGKIDPNQGGIVQTEAGDWWFVTHIGTGFWAGRVGNLLPVHWVDGWPIPGEIGTDKIGKMVWTAKKPIMGFPLADKQTDEEFHGPQFGVQWEWNYQPRAEKWSLTERPGFLRLHAFRPLEPGNIKKAGNTLTQRSLRTASNEVTVKVDLSGMADGQQSGICHFAKTSSLFGVTQRDGVRILTYNNDGAVSSGPVLTGTDLWLRSVWDGNGLSRYSYSTDGTQFVDFGDPYQLSWGQYRGDRIGIYSFNDKSDKGYLDVDWFHYNFARPGR